MKIKDKLQDIDFVDDEHIGDQYDIAKSLLKVHSEERTKIGTTDLVVARFENEKDKQYIFDMDYAGSYVFMTFNQAIFNYRQLCSLNGIQPDEQVIIRMKQIRDETYKLFTDRIQLLSWLNRNKKDNYLAKIVMKSNEDDEQAKMEDEKTANVLISNIKQKLGKEKHKEGDI